MLCCSPSNNPLWTDRFSCIQFHEYKLLAWQQLLGNEYKKMLNRFLVKLLLFYSVVFIHISSWTWDYFDDHLVVKNPVIVQRSNMQTADCRPIWFPKALRPEEIIKMNSNPSKGSCSLKMKANPVVNLPQGRAEGTILESRQCRDYFVFYGIPFAKQPKRFQVCSFYIKMCLLNWTMEWHWYRNYSLCNFLASGKMGAVVWDLGCYKTARALCTSQSYLATRVWFWRLSFP